ncbi:MAG TPA: beta/gamma crystallin domain-containing protein [Nitrospiraceae bacterium]|nr:beta/gamma crystallin domain-containing protein [Nitrospiraceae bacterium]
MKIAWTTAAAIIIGAWLAPAYAADIEMKAVDKNCWVEIFEDDEFDQDDPHAVIQGPAEFATLKGVGGRDWSDDIESVIVGPSATVKAYSHKDFEGTEVAFTPNQRVPKLSKLNMGNEIESMIISCGK